MNLVFLGPPGAGKGTIAALVKDHLKIPHISTGELFRAAIKDETSLGLQVKDLLAKGELVPDELTIEIVKERLNQDDTSNGFLLDGFPRTILQAEALSKISSISHVINFELHDSEIIKRLSGRRVCKKCGNGFHIDFIPPKKEGVCDHCGGELFTRPDDSIDAISYRLEVYKKQTEPLIQFYSNTGLIKNIDASPSVEIVFESLKTVL